MIAHSLIVLKVLKYLPGLVIITIDMENKNKQTNKMILAKKLYHY